jgi:hypothetical protein
MARRDCLAPPVDGTRDRELYDRFADFLRNAGPPPTRDPLTPARLYHLKFLAWHCSPVALNLTERLEAHR